MAWLIGPDAVNKVETIYRSFSLGRIEKAKNIFPEGMISDFHPILTDEHFYTKFTADEISELIKIKYPFCYDRDSQVARLQIYPRCTFLDTFEGIAPVTKINSDILVSEPEAELEIETALLDIDEILPWLGEICSIVIKDICLVSFFGETRRVGGSSDARLIGTIFCCLKPEPYSRIDLIVCLAHEIGHQVLMVYQMGQNPVSPKARDKQIYSAIRKTDRPIYGSFHALVALGYMIAACAGISESSIFSASEKKYASELESEFRGDLKIGLKHLEKSDLNPIAQLIANELVDFGYSKKNRS